ncbi:MAG: hypothetical protein VR72_14210 [Clostridiaceae bacterium BRH_c20a]|nr:MAG: hypothetical protein VR72_14210 [Clostridiaceae bacterium BRH_c20a]
MIMEEKYILKCTRCLCGHWEMKITHIDTDGNLYCIRCAAYMKKVGGYDLIPFNAADFIYKFSKD